MKQFTFYEAQFSVDVEETKACYAVSELIEESCPCENCHTYLEAIDAISPAVKQLFLDLGVDLKRGGEVIALQQDEEVLFMAYYTVVGEAIKTGDSTISINDITISCTTELEKVQEHFPENVFQVHLQFSYEK